MQLLNSGYTVQTNLTFKLSYIRPPENCVNIKKILIFRNQNIFCGYSKEPSQNRLTEPRHVLTYE